jgi:predicted transcriptional regulator
MENGNIQSIGQGFAGMAFTHSPDTMSGIPAPGSVGPVPAEEEVIILEAGQEKAQKFIKVMSNQNASEVIQLLKDGGNLRLSDIADKLGMSLNATKYHVENMMDAGLLEISNTRYSVKGRKTKVYRMKNQIFIVAPAMTEKKQIISAVMKYGSFLGVYILVAIGLFALVPMPELTGSIPLTGALQPSGFPAGSTVLADQGYLVALIIAAVITLLILIGYEAYEYSRNRWTAGY